MAEVIVYVDGFNLFYGLKALADRKWLWLDLESLSHSFCRANDQLVCVRYFTADVRNDPPGKRRQALYLSALREGSKIDVQKGKFQEKKLRCFNCNHSWVAYEEKETDVAIACMLIEDAVLGRWDRALIVSADADLCPAVRTVRHLDSEKTIIAASPPRRNSEELKQVCHGSFRISENKIRKSQLPNPMIRSDGSTIEKPEHWQQ
jgi:uncharacterized LabA/DUF88 family protein